MKLIHTSDLHIGKRLNEYSLLEEQRHILSRIADIAADENAAAVIIAGDVYDKTTPSAEAVAVFDAFIKKLALLKIKAFIISGNHDSPQRLAFGNSLMENSGIYISGVFDGTCSCTVLEDGKEKAYIHMLPFIRPADIREIYEVQCDTYDEAVKIAAGHLEKHNDGANILIAHQFVTGAVRSESEEVNVGGIENVSADAFEDFDYVALGHIHKAQNIKANKIRYSGTPLKYSVSEASDEKSVTIISLENQKISTSIKKLAPLRDLRKIKGSYDELLMLKNYLGTDCEDYICVTLTDEEEIPDAVNRLKVIYPNIIRLEYDNIRTGHDNVIQASGDIERKTPLELFEELYALQNNKEMEEDKKKFAEAIINEVLGI